MLILAQSAGLDPVSLGRIDFRVAELGVVSARRGRTSLPSTASLFSLCDVLCKVDERRAHARTKLGALDASRHCSPSGGLFFNHIVLGYRRTKEGQSPDWSANGIAASFAKFIAASIKWVTEALAPESGAASGFGETP